MTPGVPNALESVPLEYVRTAIDWLTEQRGVDAERIGVRGASRGAELALLLASRDPRIKAVVAVAPSSVAWSGLPNFVAPAWTEGSDPVPFLVPKVDGGRTGFQWYLDALALPEAQAAAIPVERINGPVLTINGADDQLWPSQLMAEQVMARLGAANHPHPDRHVTLPGTGHIIPLPNEPTTGLPYGGNPRDAARGALVAWHESLRFLDDCLNAGAPYRGHEASNNRGQTSRCFTSVFGAIAR